MKSITTINRNQKAQYLRGSAAKPEYVFSVQGKTETVEGSGALKTEYFDIESDVCATKEEAIKSAWRNAVAYLKQLPGIYEKTDDYHRTVCADQTF